MFDLGSNFQSNLWKFWFFYFFHFFRKKFRNFVRDFDLDITYGRFQDLAHDLRSDPKSPENKLSEKSTVWSLIKNWNFNANGPKMLQTLPETICPDTVLLFESRISYPALRVTSNNDLSKIKRFVWFRLKFSIKFIKNQIFSLFSFFSKIFETLFGISTLIKPIGGFRT